jgi:protein-S-isoprenylcysteine O-methyltransferase Ste14
MRLTLLGLFLTLPNAITLVIIVVGDILIQIQVRLEEEFLDKTHGATYQNYRQKTRRWI